MTTYTSLQGAPLGAQLLFRRMRNAVLVTAAALLVACNPDGTPMGPPPPPPAAPVLLKDIVIPNVPSPYYHFEYDAENRVKTVSFASGLRAYDVIYDGGRIAEMRSTLPLNGDRLQYAYDVEGRVASVKYLDNSGQLKAILFLTYSGAQLTEIERDRKVSAGFLAEKIMKFSYDTDGNVLEITETLRTEDTPATTTVDRYEQYDGKVNVDGFSLVHDEFFDHLVLLPGVQLQKSNPGRVTRTGDGINYILDYTYTYDTENRPLVKSGDLVFTNVEPGRRFNTRSEYSYY